MQQDMIRGIELQDDNVSDISVEEIQPEGLDPYSFQARQIEGLPNMHELAEIMANEDTYMEYMRAVFGDEIESLIEM